MSFELRPYQSEAVKSVYRSLGNERNPVIVAPTGSGKTVMICELIKTYAQAGQRILSLTHVKELISQLDETLNKFPVGVEHGVYCAGLNKKEIKPLTIGSVQSLCRVKNLDFDIVLIDEAHRLNDKNCESQYMKVIEKCKPNAIIGLSASPWRMDNGLIYGPGRLFDEVCHEITYQELLEQGHLCELVYYAPKNELDARKLRMLNGDYDTEQQREEFNTVKAVQELVSVVRDEKRNSVLIFASNSKHAEEILQLLRTYTDHESDMVLGNTNSIQRDHIIRKFKNGYLRYLVSIDVCSTGFDAPRIDCLAMLRASTSPAWVLQALGRAARVHESKEHALILDFAQNTKWIGRLGNIQAPVSADGELIKGKPKQSVERKCEYCGRYTPIGSDMCDICGIEILQEERKPELFSLAEQNVTEYRVNGMTHELTSTGNIVINYYVQEHGGPFKKYLILNPPRDRLWQRNSAKEWWSVRTGIKLPYSANAAMTLIEQKQMDQKVPETIKVKPTKRKGFYNIKEVWNEENQNVN